MVLLEARLGLTKLRTGPAELERQTQWNDRITRHEPTTSFFLVLGGSFSFIAWCGLTALVESYLYPHLFFVHFHCWDKARSAGWMTREGWQQLPPRGMMQSPTALRDAAIVRGKVGC